MSIFKFYLASILFKMHHVHTAKIRSFIIFPLFDNHIAADLVQFNNNLWKIVTDEKVSCN